MIHFCPDHEVVKEIVGNETEVAVFWTPPTAELLVFNGTIDLERTNLSAGLNYEPGDFFRVGLTKVEYRYTSNEVDDELCDFTVNVGKCICTSYSSDDCGFMFSNL